LTVLWAYSILWSVKKIISNGNSEVDFFYKHSYYAGNLEGIGKTYLREIDPRPADHPEIINFIRGVLKEGLCDIETGT